MTAEVRFTLPLHRVPTGSVLATDDSNPFLKAFNDAFDTKSEALKAIARKNKFGQLNVLCTKAQFATFIILRDQYGAENWVKELRAEILNSGKGLNIKNVLDVSNPGRPKVTAEEPLKNVFDSTAWTGSAPKMPDHMADAYAFLWGVHKHPPMLWDTSRYFKDSVSDRRYFYGVDLGKTPPTFVVDCETRSKWDYCPGKFTQAEDRLDRGGKTLNIAKEAAMAVGLGRKVLIFCSSEPHAERIKALIAGIDPKIFVGDSEAEKKRNDVLEEVALNFMKKADDYKRQGQDWLMRHGYPSDLTRGVYSDGRKRPAYGPFTALYERAIMNVATTRKMKREPKITTKIVPGRPVYDVFATGGTLVIDATEPKPLIYKMDIKIDTTALSKYLDAKREQLCKDALLGTVRCADGSNALAWNEALEHAAQETEKTALHLEVVSRGGGSTEAREAVRRKRANASWLRGLKKPLSGNNMPAYIDRDRLVMEKNHSRKEGEQTGQKEAWAKLMRDYNSLGFMLQMKADKMEDGMGRKKRNELWTQAALYKKLAAELKAKL